MPEVIVRRSFHLASAREELWPLVTDTDLLNRLSGMNGIQMEPHDGPDAARFLVRTSLDGFPVQYLERPYEWQSPDWFQIRREMLTGPTAWLRMRFHLEEAPDGGTDFTLELRLFPKILLLVPVAKLLGARRMRIMGEVIARIDEEHRRTGRRLPPQAARLDLGALRRAEAALEDLDPELRERLVERVRTGHDAELLRMRPFELADGWGLDRQAVLGACLRGVQEGLLELNWDLVCPSCQTASSRVDHLWEISAEGHCQLCAIDFELPMDQAVEATFRPSPALRHVEDVQFCSGGPARTPRVLAQHVLLHGQEVGIAVPGDPMRLRLFVRGGGRIDLRVVEGGPEAVALVLGGALPEELVVGCGGEVRVRSELAEDLHVKLEVPEWESQAATAFHLSTNAVFRRQFSAEVLAPGRSLKVASVALLFSDLTGSTALYSREGDASAYALVREHFDLLEACIAEHDGAIVKTIGDAIMAAFVTEDQALACALDMLRVWPRFQRDRQTARDVWLKIGVHAGPCFAVTANDLLDYFGQTVNVAARLQGAARPHEVVVRADLAARAQAEGLLEGAEVTEHFEAELKGVEDAPRLARVAIT